MADPVDLFPILKFFEPGALADYETAANAKMWGGSYPPPPQRMPVPTPRPQSPPPSLFPPSQFVPNPGMVNAPNVTRPPWLGQEVAQAPPTSVIGSMGNQRMPTFSNWKEDEGEWPNNYDPQGDLPPGPAPNFNKPLPVVLPDQQNQMDPRRNIKQRTDAGFGQNAPTDPVSQMSNAQQEQQQGSDAWKWGLLAAGLGILANNKGNYGAAGPAIGAGGMQGLQTFLGVRQQEQNNAARKQQMEQNKQYQDRSLGVQEGNLQLNKDKAAAEAAAMEQQREIALALAGNDPQKMRIAMANPPEFIKHALAQQKFDYKEREIRNGDSATQQYSIDGGKTWEQIPGSGTYSMRAARGGTDLSIKLGEDQGKAFTGPIADEVSASYKNTQSAKASQNVLNNLRTRLEDPRVIAGFGANQRIALAQFGQLLGGDERSLAATREVIQNLAELTLQSRGMLKGQGQVTEFEQKTLTKARSGEIDFTVPELKALVNVLTRWNKAQFESHEDMMRRLAPIKGSESAIQFFQAGEFPEYMAPQQTPKTPAPWEQ